MKISGYQMFVEDDINLNYERICKAIKAAAAESSDILHTPEGSLSGYNITFDNYVVRKSLDEICLLAKKLRVGLALGTCIKENDGRLYNQIRFYNKDGDFLGFHSKILTCSIRLDPPYEGELNWFAQKPLQVFNFHGVTIAGLICNDLWAHPIYSPMPDPHLTHLAANLGARIIFHSINGDRSSQEAINMNRSYHESNQKLRSKADKLYIVSVDNAYPPDKESSCRGGVIGPDGHYIYSTGLQGEDLFHCEINL